jgi:hypothetical protein
MLLILFLAALSWGDPHFTTFDGNNYTFNGRGEYTLLSLDDKSQYVVYLYILLWSNVYICNDSIANNNNYDDNYDDNDDDENDYKIW